MAARRLLVSFLLLAAAATLHATTFVVNSTAGDDDSSPGDGICAAPSGLCTLRAAITEANTTADALIKLPFSTDANPIIAGGSIYRPMTIEGRGMRQTVVSGQGNATVFWISKPFTIAGAVTIRDLTIRDGNATTSSVGGGVAVTGIECGVNVLLDRVRITNNTAPSQGGGIYSTSPFELRDSIVENNAATDTTVYDGRGGGIFMYLGCAAVNHIVRTTIRQNNASNNGGGVWADRGEFHIVNSTISSNVSNVGGGIYVYDGQTYLENATITDNRALLGYKFGGAGSGVFNNRATTSLNMANTILSDNYYPSGDFLVEDDCGGSITSYGYNIMSPGGDTLCTIYNGGFTFANPLLWGVQDNGGWSPTAAPSAGSPAIDGGDPSGCKSELTVLTTDQRGTKRPLGAACDVGAYEAGPCGDVNGDGAVNAADVVYLVGYLFAGGPPPVGTWRVNGGGAGNVSDVMTLVNYIFANGPAPMCAGT